MRPGGGRVAATPPPMDACLHTWLQCPVLQGPDPPSAAVLEVATLQRQFCTLPPVSPAGPRCSQQWTCQISCLYRGVWREPGPPPPAQGHPRGHHGTSRVRGRSRAVGKPQLYPPPLPELGPQVPAHGAWWAGTYCKTSHSINLHIFYIFPFKIQ